MPKGKTPVKGKTPPKKDMHMMNGVPMSDDEMRKRMGSLPPPAAAKRKPKVKK